MQTFSARPELTVFENNLPHMVSHHQGQFVLIKGAAAMQFFDSYEEALTAGYQRYGLQPFFVKQVTEESSTVHYVRDLGPWRV
jgi:hypothetical protein